jgi:hypothetical protein
MSLSKRSVLVIGSASDAAEIIAANLSIDVGWTAA